MKTILFRFTLVIGVIALGCCIFVLLAYAGNKSKGPLDDLFTTVNSNVASMEKKMISGRENRSNALQWFNHYRNNTVMMNAPDTFFWGAYDDNTAESFESLVSLEDSLHAKLPIISLYTAWGSKKNEVFPLLKAQAIYDLGSIPLITWEPWLDDFDAAQYPLNTTAGNKNKDGMQAIADGKFDAYIDKWAQDAKKFGAPFFLRFAHEMNDPYRYPWGPQNNKPEIFIAAWRHVVDRFKKTGAKNVIWVWSPHPAYSYAEFYPGHDYVNWIGTTAINYGTVATWSQWWSFDDIFGKFYSDVSLYKKPLIITEFGCLAVGGDRPTWFRQAFNSLQQKYPAVKALVFFHVASDNTTTYKSLDWSFRNDAKVTAAIRQVIAGPQ
jgi:beta-mannanase